MQNMKHIILAVALLVSTSATAHEMTPTYFKAIRTIYNNVYAVEMHLFNRRDDASHYQFEAYTENWEPIAFAAFDRRLTLKYGEGKTVTMYFRARDVPRLVYVCSRTVVDDTTSVSSLICSKVKE